MEEILKSELIDVHVHFFKPKLKINALENLAGLLAIGAPEYEQRTSIKELRSLVNYRFLIKELARLFDMKASEEEILEKRNKMVENELEEYISLLVKDANIKGMVVDDGYSEAFGEHALPIMEKESFQKLLENSGVKLKYVHRIEPDFKYYLEKSNDFEDFIEGIRDRVKNFAKKPEYVGFKSIIAYRTGLDLEWRSEDEAKKEFLKFKSGIYEREWFGPAVKILRQYVLGLIIEECAKHGKVMKIHTGIGDKDIVLEKSFPHLLFKFLKDERTRKTKIVLVHGGIPNISMASYLVNAFPNVYMDLSISTSFCMANLENLILESLEFAPASKIMYGSDGYYIPELFWIGALAFKKSLYFAFKNLIKKGIITEEDAIEFSRLMSYKNATEVYLF